MGNMDSNNLMEVYAGTQFDVEVVQGLLKSEDILSVIKEGMMESLSPYLDEVTLWVLPEDYDQAISIINSRDTGEIATSQE